MVEAVDRLSRLTASDWQTLRTTLTAQRIKVVALDLPTSWMMTNAADDFTQRMFEAINSMMLDVLSAVSRKDYEMRRHRAAQGIAKAKAEGKYRGRPENTDRNAGIAAQLRGGASWTEIQKSMGVSRATIAKISRRSAMAAE